MTKKNIMDEIIETAETVSFETVYDPYSKDEIEKFIIDSGSDHLATFGGSFEGGIQAQQCPSELAACIKAILDTGETINSYLEIGSAAGGSAFLIEHFFHPGKIVLVDNNQHPKAHIRPYILRDIPHDEIIGNSHDEGTINRVKDLGIEFDCLMVDGDHFYEGAKSDVDAYGNLLKDGGFLIFHDSKIGSPFGCYQVAQELKEDEEWKVIGEYISEIGPVCGILLLKKSITDKNV